MRNNIQDSFNGNSEAVESVFTDITSLLLDTLNLLDGTVEQKTFNFKIVFKRYGFFLTSAGINPFSDYNLQFAIKISTCTSRKSWTRM